MKRIKQNTWGNWNGYDGRKKVIEFGNNGRKAALWLSGENKLIDWTICFRGNLVLYFETWDGALDKVYNIS